MKNFLTNKFVTLVSLTLAITFSTNCSTLKQLRSKKPEATAIKKTPVNKIEQTEAPIIPSEERITNIPPLEITKEERRVEGMIAPDVGNIPSRRDLEEVETPLNIPSPNLGSSAIKP